MRRFIQFNRYLDPNAEGGGADEQPNVADDPTGGVEGTPAEPTDAEVFDGLSEDEVATLSEEDRQYCRTQHKVRQTLTTVQYAQLAKLAEYGTSAYERDMAAQTAAKNKPAEPKPEPVVDETAEQKQIRELKARVEQMESTGKQTAERNRGKEFAENFSSVAKAHELSADNAKAQKLLKRLAVGIVATEGFNGKDDQAAVRAVMDEIKTAIVDPAKTLAVQNYLKGKFNTQTLGEVRSSAPPTRSSSDKTYGAKEWKDGTVLNETMQEFVAGARADQT